MFKNITPHVITGTLPGFVSLDDALQRMPFVPTTGQQNKSVGWIAPRSDDGALVESVNGQWIMRFMAETRQVPASVVKRRVDELAAAIEADTGRKPGKKQRRDLQEQAVAELLPNAFPRKRATWVWIDREKSRLIIDSTSAGTIDDIITALVKLVDGLVAEPLRTVAAPALVMSAWLSDQAATGDFEIGNACKLAGIGIPREVISYKNHPLPSEEVMNHITCGKVCTSLELEWDGRVSFTLTDDLKLKKISFSDGVLEQSKAQGQRADDFDGNVLMATSEIGQMLDELIAELDGVAK
jgi:recombination associated protein RdgC